VSEPKKICGHRRSCECETCYYCTEVFRGREKWPQLLEHMRVAHPLADRVNERQWRWLYAPPAYRVLHRLAAMTWNMDDEGLEGWYGARCCVGAAACGYVPKAAERTPAGWFAMPGIFSRLGLPRCAKCCAKVGIPRGYGTPWNDHELREIGLGDR